ncbi:hypothetical protein BGZ50_009829 [Haplosporangium sp. Z 11]|nr:hypothetical protein BGZ50_009829 [Haplosporangium sp. Z 11]
MPRSSDIRERVLAHYSPNHFKDYIQLTPAQFNHLKTLIEGSRHFQSRDESASQTSVDMQLKVALFRLGALDVSTPYVALLMGVGRGPVHAFTWRQWKFEAITDKNRFFQGRDYLLANAAYGVSSVIILRYKNAIGDQLRYNGRHGPARVKIEHSFGMLKLKFQSLQRLTSKIDRPRDVTKTSHWVTACVVLHNFTGIHGEDAVSEDDLQEVIRRNREEKFGPTEEEEGDDEVLRNERAIGAQKRNELKNAVLEHYNRHR